MTREEAKSAIINEGPVIVDDIIYKKITALIYRYKKNRWSVFAELKDKNENSITIASLKKVKLLEN